MGKDTEVFGFSLQRARLYMTEQGANSRGSKFVAGTIFYTLLRMT